MVTNTPNDVNDGNADLQYACIFPLTEIRDCNFGDNSIVASICPKVTDPDRVEGGDQNPAFGYNPAIAALIHRAKEALGGRCMPRSFDVDESDKIACTIVEATTTPYECDEAQGRSEVDDAVAAAAAEELGRSGFCGGTTGIDCDSYSLCYIDQLSGDAHEVCLTRPDYPAASVPGFCYIDADQNVGNEALLVGCPETEQRKLRFVGQDTPRPGSMTFIVCDGL